MKREAALVGQIADHATAKIRESKETVKPSTSCRVKRFYVEMVLLAIVGIVTTWAIFHH